jgi:hypothetical protein
MALFRAHPAIAATITYMQKFNSRRNPARDFTIPNAIIIYIELKMKQQRRVNLQRWRRN